MNNFKEYMMPTLVLVLICLVVTFALDRTYTVTEPIIKMAAEKEAEKARDLVLPESGGFEMMGSSDNEVGSSIKLETNVDNVYKSKNGSGFVITTTDKGYGGKISVMTGFSEEGVIKAVILLEQKETPGLGTKVGEETFVSQFVGAENVAAIDTISGATISSNAMIRAVDSAFNQMDHIRKGASI